MTALTFHDLHRAGRPLVLPNAWDVLSALAFVEAGYPALGTTSFGVAAALGDPDGGRASKDANLRLAAALSTLPVHVSVDIEDGYADDPDAVAEYVAQLVGVGVAGINIEDSTAERLVPAASLAAKVAAVKRRSPDLFVNARVDTYWLGQDATVEDTAARAVRYVRAGADGVFVPGLSEPDALREVTERIEAPVNVLAVPGRSAAELGELGVRRISTGSLPYRAAVRAAIDVAAAVRDGGSPPPALPYPQLQALLVQHERRAAGPGTTTTLE